MYPDGIVTSLVRTVYVIVLLTSAYSLRGQEKATVEPWVPPEGPHATLLQRALVDRDAASFEQAVALGLDSADAIEAYMEHPNGGVRQRAVYLVARIPQAAPHALEKALRSTDFDLRYAATASIGKYLENPDVAEAFGASLVGKPYESAIAGEARAQITGLNNVSRQRCARVILDQILPVLVESVPDSTTSYSPNPQAIREFVLTVGLLSTPGDVTALSALQSLSTSAQARFYAHPALNGIHVGERQRNLDWVLEAIQFAEANLGRKEALAAYADDIRNGGIDTRQSRLKLLADFHPTVPVLQLATVLLHDFTEVQNVAPSHAPNPIMKRTCDFAVTALKHWYDDFPSAGNERRKYINDWRRYTDEELDEARTWLKNKLDERAAANPQ